MAQPAHLPATPRAAPETAIAQFWRDPALPHVESRRACHSRANYKPHSHPTYSIGAVDQGASLFTGAADGPTLIRSASLVFVPAGCVHACNPLPETAWSYQMLHLDARWLAALRAETQTGASAPEPVLISHDPALYQRFCQLNRLLFSAAGSAEKDAALIEFIGDHDGADPQRIDIAANPALASGEFKRLMDFLQHDNHSLLPLAELAAMAGMSRYQLIRAFRASTGLTPHAYQLNRCINQARHWLREGQGMASIAYRLGFADQAHFQRVFKAHVGVTPGLYRS